jgi:hypothetical protein
MEQSEVGDNAIAEMRLMLEKHVSKEETWWSKLSIRNRKGILKLTDTNTYFSSKDWPEITPEIRYRIIRTAIQASKWLNDIGHPNCLKPTKHE